MKEIDPDIILAMDCFISKERSEANKSDFMKASMSIDWSNCQRSFQLSGKEEVLDIVEFDIDSYVIFKVTIKVKWR